MRRLALAIPLVILLTGQSSDCSRDVDVRRFRGDNDKIVTFSQSANDGRPLPDFDGTYLGDGDGNRFEMWRLDPNTTRAFEEGGLDHTRYTWGGVAENQWLSMSGVEDVYLPAKFSGPVGGTIPQEQFGFVFDEGECSLTVPWDRAHLAPHLASTLPEEGLAEIIVGEFNQALREMESEEEPTGVFWGVEWVSGLSLNQNLPTQFFVDPGYVRAPLFGDPPPDLYDPNHRICLKAFAGTGGKLEWNADGSRFVLADSVGFLFTGILNFFNIGDCGDDRLLAMTVCGRFGAVAEDEVVSKRRNPFKGPEPAQAGDVAFEVSSVDVQINDWPKIKVACNNNKPAMEEGLETILRETVESGMNELAEAFDLFDYSRCYVSMEGLTCVIAETVHDPEYELANALGFCHQRRPTIEAYLETVQYEEMP